MTLYLAWFDDDAEIDPPADDDAFTLAPGLMLIDTDRTRSRVYHALKRKLPPDTALLVAPLADAPKFKGLADGALKWVRQRDD